jgi:hypothetical protein
VRAEACFVVLIEYIVVLNYQYTNIDIFPLIRSFAVASST